MFQTFKNEFARNINNISSIKIWYILWIVIVTTGNLFCCFNKGFILFSQPFLAIDLQNIAETKESAPYMDTLRPGRPAAQFEPGTLIPYATCLAP